MNTNICMHLMKISPQEAPGGKAPSASLVAQTQRMAPDFGVSLSHGSKTGIYGCASPLCEYAIICADGCGSKLWYFT